MDRTVYDSRPVMIDHSGEYVPKRLVRLPPDLTWGRNSVLTANHPVGFLMRLALEVL
jgi:hypothetical protein